MRRGIGVLLVSPLAGCGSQLSVEQQAWCAFHGEEVRVFRAAMDEAWGNGWTGTAVIIEGSSRAPTADEAACWAAYRAWHGLPVEEQSLDNLENPP